MRALVTGAAGFIGSHIVEQLVNDGHFVLGVDSLAGGTWDNIAQVKQVMPIGASSTNGRFSQTRDCAGLNAHDFKAFEIDTLVHCAANAREGASQFQPRNVTHNNLNAYIGTLTAAIQAGVKNVILFSSMAVYGNQTPPFDETMALIPEDVYGINKAAMEQCTHVLAEVHGLNYLIIRPHNVIGERQCLSDKFRNVAAIFMNRIMRSEPLFIYGDGGQRRAFSYIGDSLPSFMKSIYDCATLGANGLVVNIGGTQEITVNQLAAKVKSAMGVGQDYPTEHFESRPREVRFAFSTYTKSVELLSYADTMGWETGVERMAEWAKDQGPQEWRNAQPLEIITDKTPKPWLT